MTVWDLCCTFLFCQIAVGTSTKIANLTVALKKKRDKRMMLILSFYPRDFKLEQGFISKVAFLRKREIKESQNIKFVGIVLYAIQFLLINCVFRVRCDGKSHFDGSFEILPLFVCLRKGYCLVTCSWQDSLVVQSQRRSPYS